MLLLIPCHQVLELVDEEGGGQSSNSPMWDGDQLPEQQHVGKRYSWQTISGNKILGYNLHIGQRKPRVRASVATILERHCGQEKRCTQHNIFMYLCRKIASLKI